MTPHIQLSSGAFFNFLEPDPALVTPEVIGRSLAKLCRFTGHASRFYSVAQHSVLVSRLVPPHLARWGLYHDAAEAFLGDVASPLKQLLPDYKSLEAWIEQTVWGALGLEGNLPREVKLADMSALVAERAALMPMVPGADAGWEDYADVPPCEIPIIPLMPFHAESFFLARAAQLGDRRLAA